MTAFVASVVSLVVTLLSQSSVAAILKLVPPVELLPFLFRIWLSAPLSVAFKVIENAVLLVAVTLEVVSV